MRVKVNLTAERNISIPIEYNYNVYLNLRKTLFEYLKTAKPKLFPKYKRDFPNFTFSQLMIPERIIETGYIHIKGNFFALWISSDDDEFIEYLVKAINHQNSFSIYSHQFKLKKIDMIEEPTFKTAMNFKMLSPMLLAISENEKTRFLRPTDSDLSNVFGAQLILNFNDFYKSKLQPSDITFIPNQDYMERKKNLTKLITVREVHYKTIFCPFTLSGDKELIRFAWRNGIGIKTNYGFGMIDVVNQF